jgi:hypothetical protein
VKAIRARTTARAAVVVRCDVVASAVFQAPADQFPALRQNPGPLQGKPPPTGFLKHSDEQTVAGLLAVQRAIEAYRLEDTPLTDWGVVAAPRFLGRGAMVPALERFATEGAWGISPHLIPHRSLHSISGTLSQALKIHGPNFGAGGGIEGSSEALLMAAGMLSSNRLPALWLVFTGWMPEPFEECGPSSYVCPEVPHVPVCSAVALALRPPSPEFAGPWLDIIPAGAINGRARNPAATARLFSLENLAAALAVGPTMPPQTWDLSCGGNVQLTK